MDSKKRTYRKAPTTYAEQIDLLRQRGMVIEEPVEAAFYLQHIHYYRLRAYWLPFEADHTTHTLRPNVRFCDVLNLYVFDRELRLLVLDAIERVEVSVRGRWAHEMAHSHGPHAHLDESLAKNSKHWKTDDDTLTKEIKRSKERFIQHFQSEYAEASPPIWAVCEVMSFGLLSRWYNNLKPMPTRRAIAAAYGLDDKVLESWLRHLTHVRNICAHHNRLWNREFTITPSLPQSKPKQLVTQFVDSRKLYNTLVILLHFMDVISPRHHWRKRLITLMDDHAIPVTDMGFPKDWQQYPIWKEDTYPHPHAKHKIQEIPENPHTTSRLNARFGWFERAMSINVEHMTEWIEAIFNRDPQFDGMFVYGVRSTGIYCRPSCPARRPKREHILLFPSVEGAQCAGFRACKRCKPETVSSRQWAVARIRHLIETSDTEPNLECLAKSVGLSPFHLQRTFKQATGLSPKKYAQLERLKRFRGHLQEGLSVTDASYEAGFGSTNALYKETSSLGMSPKIYRAGGSEQRIEYTISTSEIGDILVATTEKGICALWLGQTDALLETLKREFPKATLESNPDKLRPVLENICNYLMGQKKSPIVLLDVQGSEFQNRVWKALQDIPYGETRSYQDVARAIGSPESVRAVARACSQNQVALIIPCHRVLRKDGSLSGYKWATERKQWLLELEHRN